MLIHLFAIHLNNDYAELMSESQKNCLFHGKGIKILKSKKGFKDC